MSERVNLLDHWASRRSYADRTPQLVRIGPDQTPVIPFTSDITPVHLHYCDESDLQGYVHCNGDNCVLCRAGRKVVEHVLLPVYLPQTSAIGVLSISSSSQPGALRPQLLPVLQSPQRVVLLIHKPDKTTFKVTPADLPEGVDDGGSTIQAFQQEWEAGQIDLKRVYTRYDNYTLSRYPGIAMMLKYKGITVDA